jgi:hypothetical protein
VDEQDAHSGDLSDFECFDEEVFEERRAESLALVVRVVNVTRFLGHLITRETV